MNKLVEGLLEDMVDDEILYAKGEKPKSMSLYTSAGVPTPEVLLAQERLIAMGQKVCELPIFTDTATIMGLLNGDHIWLHAHSLVVIIHYEQQHQRILELHLSDTKATLHFVRD